MQGPIGAFIGWLCHNVIESWVIIAVAKLQIGHGYILALLIKSLEHKVNQLVVEDEISFFGFTVIHKLSQLFENSVYVIVVGYNYFQEILAHELRYLFLVGVPFQFLFYPWDCHYIGIRTAGVSKCVLG